MIPSMILFLVLFKLFIVVGMLCHCIYLKYMGIFGHKCVFVKSHWKFQDYDINELFMEVIAKFSRANILSKYAS